MNNLHAALFRGDSFLNARYAGTIPENRGDFNCDEFVGRATFVLTQRIVPDGAASFHRAGKLGLFCRMGWPTSGFPAGFCVTVPGSKALPIEPGKGPNPMSRRQQSNDRLNCAETSDGWHFMSCPGGSKNFLFAAAASSGWVARTGMERKPWPQPYQPEGTSVPGTGAPPQCRRRPLSETGFVCTELQGGAGAR
jgi:hypothetical protein